MSDTGGDNAVAGQSLVLDDEATAPLTSAPVTTGIYRPTDLGGGPDAFTAPAPAESGNTSLGVFDGTPAAGTWSLYVVDDATGEFGSFASWGLTVRTKSDPYPSTVNVSGMGTKVFDVDVRLNGLTHTYPDDLDVLLVGPGGQRTRLMSDVGAFHGVTDLDLTFDDEATDVLPDEAALTPGTFKPTDADEDGYPDNFDPAPAPTADTSLSTFDGTDPNGTWSLYVMDDAGRDVGTLAGWSLDIETDGTAPTGTVVVNGGGALTTSHTVTLTLAATDPGSPASGVTAMRFSNDGVTWSAFQPYAAAATWTLSGGDGTKSVYAQFRDGSGILSPVASDAISLDSTGPRATKVRPRGGAKHVGVDVKIRVVASEALAAGSVTKRTVVLRQKGVGKVKAKVTYLAARNVIKLVPKQPLDPDATYVVKVRRVKDLNGLVWDQKPAVNGAQRLRSTFTTT
jgi:subtilisin-like proprotein convertase family protein